MTDNKEVSLEDTLRYGSGTRASDIYPNNAGEVTALTKDGKLVFIGDFALWDNPDLYDKYPDAETLAVIIPPEEINAAINNPGERNLYVNDQVYGDRALPMTVKEAQDWINKNVVAILLGPSPEYAKEHEKFWSQ